MTKRIFLGFTALFLVLVLSACGDAALQAGTTTSTVSTTTVSTQESGTTSQPSGTTVIRPITRDQAKAIALQHAKLTEANVRRVEAERDRERGVLVYEVEFDHQGYEYSYDIHAETGEVLWFEKELDD